MRHLFLSIMMLLFSFSQAQVQTPQPSPSANLTQVVGLTEFNVKYSRPSMKGREIFGSLVPYDQLWRTGANNNTIISFDDAIVFGEQEVDAGEYALFTIPGEDKWEVFLYAKTDNWGTPQEWDESLIVAQTTVEVSELSETVESFTIDFGHFTKDSAHLVINWENTSAHILIQVPSDRKVMASIEAAMKNPKPTDYFNAAVYFLETGKDINKARVWIDKAMDAREDKPFWMLRQQSLIYAEAGEKQKAIEIAKQSLEAAEKAGNRDYVMMNRASLAEWGAY